MKFGIMYDMLSSLTLLRNFVGRLKWSAKGDGMKYSLSDDEWETVDGMLKDLRPVRKATSQVQREDMTLGEFLSIWTVAVMSLKKLSAASSSLATSLVSAMEARCEGVMYSDRRRGERQPPLLEYPSFHAAVFMDPRFFSLLTAQQIQEAKTYLLELYASGPRPCGLGSRGCQREQRRGRNGDTFRARQRQ